MRFRMLPAAAALAVALLLVGCVPSDPIITPEPVPEFTPVFASDEEALAAATEAYGKYLAVVDEVFSAGGENLDALPSVLVGHQLEVETKGFESAKAAGLHSVGATKFDQISLQRFENVSENPVIIVYLCEDISEIDVLNESGKSVVDQGLPARSLYEVTFGFNSGVPPLLVSNKELWEAGKC